MPVGLFSEEEESSVWINVSNPLSACSDISEDVESSLVSCAVSVSSYSDVPFLPNVGWCSPVQDVIDVDSGVGICLCSVGWVTLIGVWAW
jgi:hypothetical protein